MNNNLHILFWGEYEKRYIEFINKNFNHEVNMIILVRTENISGYDEFNGDNIIKFNSLKEALSKSKKYFNRADKIFLHGLFSNRIVLFFFIHKKYLKKVNWVIWGGDLYYYKYRKHTLKSNIKEFIKKSVIKNMGQITSLIKGDYELAKSIYKTKARYNYAFYSLPVDFKLLDKSIKECNKRDNTITIQVGNSADPTNEHIEILDNLSKYKNEDIRIICPLSYGDKEHASKVINYGKQIFKDKFIPLTDYLKPEEYSKILVSVDIAIFNHRRQQALGNIIALLYLGKKVYIRSDITPWSYFKGLDIKIFDTINLKDEIFDRLISFDQEMGKKNRKIVGEEFTEEHCVELWKKVFER